MPPPILETASGETPVGSIVMWAGGLALPTGWLRCDGQLLNRILYADLFNVLGEGWGPGDGTTTFQLPDTRGVFPKGAGTTDRVPGKDSAGAFYSGTYGSYPTDRMQGHYHFNYISGGAGAVEARLPVPAQVRTLVSVTDGPAQDGTNGIPRTGRTTEPQSIGIYFIIKVIKLLQGNETVIRVAV